jgi:putative DNA primase/helicase
MNSLEPVSRYALSQLAAWAGLGTADPPARKQAPKNWQEAGGCDNYFTSLGGSMRGRGMSEEAILAALLAENDALEDPMPRARVEKIAKSVSRYAPKPEEDRVYRCTDAGNAERFAAKNRDVRYCTDRGAWLVWDGTRWAEDTEGSIAAHRTLVTARTIDDEVAACPEDQPELRAALRGWARKSEGADRLSAMVRVARTLPEVKCRAVDFDSDPWVLNVENGILDLRRGELRPHDRGAMCSKLAPVRFVPGAAHPMLDKYLADTTGGDAEFIAFLQRALGYSLTGSTAAESIFLVLGPGGSGKTTLVEAFKDLLGDYALTAAAKTLLEKRGDSGHTSDIARMHGRRLICTSEIAKGKQLDSALIKSLTGGERIVAREIYSSDAEFVPMAKFWLAANDAPGVADDDSGMWRRIIRVPFVRVVPEADRDPNLKDTLRNDPGARAAILAWAVQGCLDWQARGGGRQGLGVPGVVHKATIAYRNDQNPLKDFLDETCEVGPTKMVEVAALRREYADYIRSAGTKPIPPHDFNARLEAEGYQRKVAKIGKRPARVWVGLSLISDARGGSDGAQPIPDDAPF